MIIDSRLTKDEILTHTAEMLDSIVSKKHHNQRLLMALTIGLLFGLMA